MTDSWVKQIYILPYTWDCQENNIIMFIVYIYCSYLLNRNQSHIQRVGFIYFSFCTLLQIMLIIIIFLFSLYFLMHPCFISLKYLSTLNLLTFCRINNIAKYLTIHNRHLTTTNVPTIYSILSHCLVKSLFCQLFNSVLRALKTL